MSWLQRNLDFVLGLMREHLALALIPVLLGLVISIPLGWVASRNRYSRAALITITGVLYTIPSLALIVILPVLLGTQILDYINVFVSM